MDPQEQQITPKPTSRPFAEIPELWLKFPQMTEDFFRSEKIFASPSNTLYSILILTGIVTVISVISSLLTSVLGLSFLEESLGQADYLSLGGLTLYTLCCGLFITPVSFYLRNGFNYLGAKIFGGKGDFSAQAYLSSLYYVPLTILISAGSLFSIIPIVGTCLVPLIFFGILIYQLILAVRSMSVVHDLSPGRAFAALILFPGILLLIGVCLVVGLALSGPAIGNIFSNIINELGTPMP